MNDRHLVQKLRERYTRDVTPELLDEAADEIERLREANEALSVILSGEPVWREMWSEYCTLKEDVAALRGALQSLVDATYSLNADVRIAARAVAVAVLTGQEPT